MPFRHQKFAKNGPEMYLLIGLNPILLILRFDNPLLVKKPLVSERKNGRRY